jgi:ABC-type amino acid transport substrate-binding protein
LLPALADGKGDVAAGNLTVTPERSKRVDFSVPTLTGVSEVLITGPASADHARLDDLAGKEVFVRKSDSYYMQPVGAEPALRGTEKDAGRPQAGAGGA